MFDFSEERFREIAQLLPAHAGNSLELGGGCGIDACHLAKGDVGKNHVSWNVALVGQLSAHDPQMLEQDFIALDFTVAWFLTLRRKIDMFRERDRRALAQS